MRKGHRRTGRSRRSGQRRTRRPAYRGSGRRRGRSPRRPCRAAGVGLDVAVGGEGWVGAMPSVIMYPACAPARVARTAATKASWSPIAWSAGRISTKASGLCAATWSAATAGAESRRQRSSRMAASTRRGSGSGCVDCWRGRMPTRRWSPWQPRWRASSGRFCAMGGTSRRPWPPDPSSGRAARRPTDVGGW